MVTRRQFTTAAGSAIVLTVLGDDTSIGQAVWPGHQGQPVPRSKSRTKKRHASKLAKAPFLIGEPSKYAPAGVYDDYEHKGVWLVSDGQQLVALNSTCTHLACATKLDKPKNQFTCPCHKSRFTAEGDQLGGSKAKRPLERCAMRLIDGQIQVDPTRRFRKEKGQWDDPVSAYRFSG